MIFFYTAIVELENKQVEIQMFINLNFVQRGAVVDDNGRTVVVLTLDAISSPKGVSTSEVVVSKPNEVEDLLTKLKTLQ